jgi:hypothetical protein
MKLPDDAAMVLFRGIDLLVEELPRIVEMAKNEERAAVVAWLREWSKPPGSFYDLSGRTSVLLEASDIIERGEHRREEEKS